MTLEHMRRYAIDGSRTIEVRRAAIQALDRFGTPAHNPRAAIHAVYRFIQDRIRFVPDPVGTQAIQSPRATLSFGAGNCAQRATLLAAMLMAIGIPARLQFRVIGANPSQPHLFSHVYVVAGGIPLDPTYPNNPVGFEYPNPSRVGDFDL